VPANAVVSARIDRRLKQEAEAVLAAKGLSVSEALRQMMMRIAQEKALPFELTVPGSKPTKERKRKMYDIVTPGMRHHVAFRTLNHLGFRGYRAAIAAQQSFDLLDRSPNNAARLGGLNLALQLEQAPIGAVETLRQDRRNVKERDRVYPKYGGRIGDVKLRGFQRTYVRRMRLIQQHGEFAEYGAGLRRNAADQQLTRPA